MSRIYGIPKETDAAIKNAIATALNDGFDVKVVVVNNGGLLAGLYLLIGHKQRRPPPSIIASSSIFQSSSLDEVFRAICSQLGIESVDTYVSSRV